MSKFKITEEVHSVYLQDVSLFGNPMYLVRVNDKIFDTITSDTRLTHAEQTDIANGYREALTGYRSPC